MPALRELRVQVNNRKHGVTARMNELARFLPLSHRTHPHEILDEGDHPEDELFGTFEDMRRVNLLLGGTRITLRGLRRLIGSVPDEATVRILDIGTGHADIPRSVREWLHDRGYSSCITGLDIDFATLHTAMQLPSNQDISFTQADILHLPFVDNAFDITMSSMTLHHLEDGDAIAALQEMARVSRVGIIINDLKRTLHGYAVAWALGRIATSNRLTRHDAHRSIQRGRNEAELERLALGAGLNAPVFDSTLGYRTAMTIGVRPWQ
jgi:2-polyprenyl-3-methyl-5-hydroxy-6-metoxy-1,4-benzoquinol methylase